MVVGHTPRPDAPAGYFARWRSYDNLIQVMLEAFPGAKLPDQPGEVFRFDSR